MLTLTKVQFDHCFITQRCVGCDGSVTVSAAIDTNKYCCEHRNERVLPSRTVSSPICPNGRPNKMTVEAAGGDETGCSGTFPYIGCLTSQLRALQRQGREREMNSNSCTQAATQQLVALIDSVYSVYGQAMF